MGRWRDIWQRFSGPGAYPHELSALLLFPLRRLVLSPQALIHHLHLAETSHVLELGPGPGFFSIDVARAIPRGRLQLVDLQAEMLRKARGRLQRAGVRHAGYVQANAVSLPFGAGSFDVAFLVAVLGEVPDPKACLAAVARVLRPGGRLAIAELPGDPDALSDVQLRALVEGTGLEFVDSARVSRALLVSFRRPAADPEPAAPSALL